MFKSQGIHILLIISLVAILFAPSQQTLAQEQDSIKKTTPLVGAALDSPLQVIDTMLSLNDDLSDRVIYSSFDSIRIDVKNDFIHLYWNASVKYGDKTIEGNHIIIDGAKKVIRSYGMPDSTGKMTGLPVYKDGDDTYKASEMSYSFKTGKAWIKDAVTEAQGGYLIGKEVKLIDKNTIYTKGNIYTTCDQTDDPHFGIRITKGKFIPGEKIIAGPSYLEIGKIPLPIGLPFAYYPMTQGKRHGLIFPEVGESQELGFFARGLGYYFPLGDHLGLEVRSDLYSLGSWRMNSRLSYVARYKYSGNLSFDISTTKVGDTESPGYSPQRELFIRWTHNQDPKARPNSRFTASVNAGTNGFWQNNSFATNKFAQNSFNSSISYNRSFPNSPFSMSASLRHSQNTSTKIVDLGVPAVALNMRRINPLKRKNKVGAAKWYEKIGMSYSMQAKNNLRQPDSTLFKGDLQNKLSSGILHQVPISTSMKLFKYVQLSPSFTFNERWYFRKVNKTFDLGENQIAVDSTNGFFAARDFSTNLSLNTRLFGIWKFKGKLAGIRHIINPSLNFAFRPDFGQEKFGYYKQVQTDSAGTNFIDYAIFEGNNGVSGLSPRGKFGNIGFGVDNNIEIKIRTDKDTVTGVKRIKILDSYRIGGGYNLAVDSLNLSTISMSARTSFKNFSARFSSTLDPYTTTTEGRRINKFYFAETGKLAELKSANITLSGSLKSLNKERKTQVGTDQELQFINKNPEDYIDFNIPFNLSFNYSIQFNKSSIDGVENTLRQNVTFSGNLNVTDNWKLVLNSGYDITEKELTPTQISIYRDLHCWDLSFNIVPFGTRRSYMFTIKPKATILQALKLTQRRDWYDYN